MARVELRAFGAALIALLPVSTARAGDYNWSGLYIGGHAGYSWSNPDWINQSCTGSGCAAAAFPDLIPGDRVSHDVDGWLGGGQVGVNFQHTNWVFGAELSYSGLNADGSSVSTFTHPLSAQDDIYRTSMRNLFLATARLGYAWDQWLGYVKGGYATASVHTSISDPVGTLVNQGQGSSSERHNGYVLGAGIEYKMTPNIIVGLEYDFVNLGDEVHTMNVVNGSGTPGTIVNRVDVDNTNILMARISYQFGRDERLAPLK